jgi:hypothetical protein
MTPLQIDQFVINRMSRATMGDDEALNQAVLTLRPLVLGAIPKEALTLAPVTVCTQEAIIALHEALILWQPASGHFVECLDRRLRSRLASLFLRLRDLQQQAEVAA